MAKFSSRDLALVVITALIAGGLTYSGINYKHTRQEVQAHESADSILAEMEKIYPAYISLKQVDPVAYAEVKTIIAQASKEDKTPAEMNFMLQPVMAKYIRTKTPFVSDEILMRSLKADLQTAKQLQADHHEDKCVGLLSGKPIHDLYGSVSKENLTMQMALLNDIILAPKIENQTIASGDDAKTVFVGIFKKVTEKMQIPMKDIGAIYNGARDDHTTCIFLTGVTDELALMPAATVAPLLRYGLTLHKN